MKIILSSYYWGGGVHAFENLIPTMNVLPGYLTCGQLVTAREQKTMYRQSLSYYTNVQSQQANYSHHCSGMLYGVHTFTTNVQSQQANYSHHCSGMLYGVYTFTTNVQSQQANYSHHCSGMLYGVYTFTTNVQSMGQTKT